MKFILNKVNKLFEKFFDYYLKSVLILTLVYLGLICAVEFIKIYSTNTPDKSFSLTLVSVIFAINIALATMVFTYASSFENKAREELLYAGERFVLSTVAFLLNLAIFGFDKTGHLTSLFENEAWGIYIVWFIALMIIVLLIGAFIYFVQGLWGLLNFIIRRRK